MYAISIYIYLDIDAWYMSHRCVYTRAGRHATSLIDLSHKDNNGTKKVPR